MVELVCVPPDMNEKVWPLAKDLIRSAIERTKLSSFEDIEDAILAGRQLLWLAWNGEAIEAAASTSIDRDVLVVVACGGSQRDNWLGLLSQIEDYAKSQGCRCVRIYGRKGWARALPAYRNRFVILERPL